MPFLDTSSKLTTKPYNFELKCQFNSESYDQQFFFGTKVREGQILLFTVGAFFIKREYSGSDWLDLLILKFYGLNLSDLGGFFVKA